MPQEFVIKKLIQSQQSYNKTTLEGKYIYLNIDEFRERENIFNKHGASSEITLRAFNTQNI